MTGHRVHLAALAAIVLAFSSEAVAEGRTKETADEIAKKSLIELAPIVVDINRRYFKFYGDPNTVNGGIRERSFLTDNWAGGGLRDKLVDAGVYFDVAMTQWGGGNVYGGTDPNGNYFGSLDLWANFDSAKLTNGLWPGGNFFLHGEVAWGREFANPRGIERSVGATIPVNYDITMPGYEDTVPERMGTWGLVFSSTTEDSFLCQV